MIYFSNVSAERRKKMKKENCLVLPTKIYEKINIRKPKMSAVDATRRH